jgi:mono/diheme cytochrome c family protein
VVPNPATKPDGWFDRVKPYISKAWLAALAAIAAVSGWASAIQDDLHGIRLALEGRPPVVSVTVDAEPPAAAQEPQVHPGLVVLLSKCSGCHSDASRAVTHGSAPQFFDGNTLRTLSDDDKVAMYGAAHRGTMPPPKGSDGKPIPPLVDDDVLAIRSFFKLE